MITLISLSFYFNDLLIDVLTSPADRNKAANKIINALQKESTQSTQSKNQR